MKKHFTLLTLSILAAANTFAGVVTLQDATTVASKFLQFKFWATTKNQSQWHFGIYPQRTNGTVDFYVFDFAPAKGFVIVSANDALSPVIGYSGESNFNTGFSTKGLGELDGSCSTTYKHCSFKTTHRPISISAASGTTTRMG